MSRKNVCWFVLSKAVLVTLICGALFAVPASAQHFQQIKGTFVSVAAGSKEVFGIDNFFKVWRFNATTQSFDKIKAAKLGQIVVGGGSLLQPDEVWGQANGVVYRFNYTTKTFDQIPGVLLSQIAVGPGVQDNCHPYEVWGVTSAQSIYRYDYCSRQFVQIAGSLTQVATGGGDVWGINGSGQIFYCYLASLEFVQVAGTLDQITVGVNDVWGINEYYLLRYDPNTGDWTNFGASVVQVAAGGDGAWVLDTSDNVYRFDSGGEWYTFDEFTTALKTIAVGSGAGVWGVNSSNQVFTFVRP